MDVLPVKPTAIPQELTSCAQWVLWRGEWRDGKWKKPLHDAKTGRRASPTDHQTWATFNEAFDRYRTGGWHGIGFVFTEDDDYCGIDVDNWRDPITGELEPWVHELVAQADSYAEASPSGRGVHIIVRACLPGPGVNNREYGVEMYDRGRYFTITGQPLHGVPQAINDGTELVVRWYPVLRPSATIARYSKPVPNSPLAASAAIPEPAGQRSADDRLLNVARYAVTSPLVCK